MKHKKILLLLFVVFLFGIVAQGDITYTLLESFGGRADTQSGTETYTLIDSFGGRAEVEQPLSQDGLTYSRIDTFGGKAQVYPIVQNVTPVNNSIGNDMYPVLNISVEHLPGTNFNITWTTNYSSWTKYNNSCTNGYFTQRASFVNLSHSRFYWTVAVNDTNNNWYNATFWFKTRGYNWTGYGGTWEFDYTGNVPTISSVTPEDGNDSVNRGTGKIRLQGTFNDGNGDKMNVSWYYSDNNTLIGTNGTISNGTYSQDIFCKYGQLINWSINLSDDINYNNQTYSFRVTNLSVVSNLLVVNYNISGINLSWNKNTNCTNTYIRWKKESHPSSRSDGFLLVNTTNRFYNHSGLDPGTPYYYSLWSYNSTDNVFSPLYVFDYNYTNPGCPSSLQDTDSTQTSISLSWTKGTNTTRSVVFVNATGFPNHNNRFQGVEKINTTGSSGTATGLTINNSYNFSVYSLTGGFWSSCNDTHNASTLGEAGDISNLVVSRYSSTQLNLTWNKATPSDDTVIRRATNNYPSNPNKGTLVHNGTGKSCVDTGLNPTTKYYYRAWAWNGVAYGSGYSSDNEITRPGKPQDFTGEIVDNDLVVNWTKGINASRTLVGNKTGSYPSNPDDCTNSTNTTLETLTFSGTSSIDYYRGWSYVEVYGVKIMSLYANLLWGGLEINVYKEDEPNIAIGNYTVFITNSDATETYQNTSQNNPFRIDVSDVPNGNDITIQIRKDGYHPRSQVMNLLENTYYTIDFYLAPSDTGSPSSESNEPWYVNGSDPDNETFSYQYIVEVVDEYEGPIEDAYVVVKNYINTTDSYETVLSAYTDSDGQTQCYLIPGVKYYVTISKLGYVTKNDFWEPTQIDYYENVIKRFQLETDVSEIDDVTFWGIITFNGTMYTNNSIKVTFIDSKNNVTNAQFTTYENFNYSSTEIAFNTTTNSRFSFWITGVNISREHFVILHLNHSVLGYEIESIIIPPLISPSYNINTITTIIASVTGDFVLGIVYFFFVFVPFLFFLLIGRNKNPGLGVVAGGVWLGFSSFLLQLPEGLVAVAIFIVSLGFILVVVKGGKAEQ